MKKNTKLFLVVALLFLGVNNLSAQCFMPLYLTGNLAVDPEMNDYANLGGWGSGRSIETVDAFCGGASIKVDGSCGGSLNMCEIYGQNSWRSKVRSKI